MQTIDLDHPLYTYEAKLVNPIAEDVKDRVEAYFWVESPDRKWKVRVKERLLELEEELLNGTSR